MPSELTETLAAEALVPANPGRYMHRRVLTHTPEILKTACGNYYRPHEYSAVTITSCGPLARAALFSMRSCPRCWR